MCLMVCVCLCLCICLLAATDSPMSKPTPLYGQPSWWGEDEDAANKKKNRGGKSPEQESPGKRMYLIFLLMCTNHRLNYSMYTEVFIYLKAECNFVLQSYLY